MRYTNNNLSDFPGKLGDPNENRTRVTGVRGRFLIFPRLFSGHLRALFRGPATGPAPMRTGLFSGSEGVMLAKLAAGAVAITFLAGVLALVCGWVQ